VLATWGNGLGLIKKSLKQVVIGGLAVIRFEALNPCDAIRTIMTVLRMPVVDRQQNILF
jgi:hypothetical protein